MSKLYDMVGQEITVGCTVAHASGARGVGLHIGRVTSVTAKRFKLAGGGNRAPECALVIQDVPRNRLRLYDRRRLSEPCENCKEDLSAVHGEDGALFAIGCDSCGAMYDLRSNQR